MAKVRASIADNGMGSKTLYEARAFYRDEVYPEDQVTPLDYWYKRPLYGKIDRNMNFVSLLEGGTLAPVTSASPVFVVDFAADAYQDFYNEYINLTVEEDRVTDLIPSKGWASFENTYKTYMDGKKEFFISTLLKRNRKSIFTFSDFVEIYLAHVREFGEELPVTKSGFVVSNINTPFTSGLVIEVEKKSHSDDFTKQALVRNPNFLFYANRAAMFGFYVDKNAPWRLIVNVSSPKMQKYMEEYGVVYRPGSASDFFSFVFFGIFIFCYS